MTCYDVSWLYLEARMVSSLDEAKADLAEYAETFERCVRDALKDYVDQFKEQRHKLSLRSQASIIHDLIVEHLKAAFGTERDGREEVFIHRAGNLNRIIIGRGKYKARMKKLDEKLLTRNIPTDAVLRFIWQENQRSFDEIPAPTHIHLGYQIVDDAALTASKVWITCPNGDQIGWRWELTAVADAAAAQAAATAQILPVVPVVEQPAKRMSVKRPENPAAEADDAADGSK